MKARATMDHLWWALAVTLALVADYLTGPIIQFPIVFVIPVLLAARLERRAPAVLTGIILPLCRASFYVLWGASITPVDVAINSLIRIVVLVVLAVVAHETLARGRALSQEVRVLRGLLPICAHCKRIRDDAGAWVAIETYIRDHSEATFTHGVCQSCALEHYGVHLDTPSRTP